MKLEHILKNNFIYNHFSLIQGCQGIQKSNYLRLLATIATFFIKNCRCFIARNNLSLKAAFQNNDVSGKKIAQRMFESAEKL